MAQGPGLIRIKSSHVAAEIGHVIHDLAESWINTGDYNMVQRCEARGLEEDDRKDIPRLMSYMSKSWETLKEFFPNLIVEQSVRSDVITADDGGKYQIVGTTDVSSAIGTDNAIFLDWKSGYIDAGYRNQLFGYAYSIWCSLGRPQNTLITGIAVFLRHNYYRVVKYDATMLSQWEYDLTHNVLPAKDQYNPGKTCEHCSLYACCPARKELVHNMIDCLVPKATPGPVTKYGQFLAESKELLASLTEENKASPSVGAMIEKLSLMMKLAQQQIDETKDMIRTAIKRVGPIVLPGSVELNMKRVEVNKVDASKGMRTLNKHMSSGNICSAMTLSLPKLMESYTKRFKRGEKTAARKQLFEALQDANAIEVKVQYRLEEQDVRRIKKETKNGSDTPRVLAHQGPANAGNITSD